MGKENKATKSVKITIDTYNNIAVAQSEYPSLKQYEIIDRGVWMILTDIARKKAAKEKRAKRFKYQRKKG